MEKETFLSEEFKLLEEFKKVENFCKVMLDAYALIDRQGRVLRCNALLSQVLKRKTKPIYRAGSLDELIEFQLPEKILKVLDFFQNETPHRIDEVKGVLKGEGLSEEHKQEMYLTIGIHQFVENNHILGIFILLRDVTAEALLQDKYKIKATQSITDKLTELYNRSFFETYFPKIVTLTFESQMRRPLSVIMADVDHFKHINDSHGHQAGDAILKGVADKFRESFRKSDVVCRYGGEEFVAILPDTDIGGAIQAAEKLRVGIAQSPFIFEDKLIPVTISLGISELGANLEKPDKVLNRADKALYQAKTSGRDRICITQGESLLEVVKISDKFSFIKKS